MLDEIVKKQKKLPTLIIKNINTFRQAFVHESTPIIFSKPTPSIQYIKWFKKDFSEICFNFVDWDKGSKDIVMEVSNDIRKFGEWWMEITANDN